MLKTSSIKSTKLKKNRVKIGSDRKNEVDNNQFDNNKVDSNEVRDNEVVEEKNHQKTSKSKKTIRSSDYFIFGNSLVFTKFRQVFIKALIFYHFDPKYNIQVKINVSGYPIGRIFNQLILNNLSR